MDSVRSILKHDQVFNIFQMYDFSVAQLMHKAKQNELPSPLQNNFETDPDLHHYFFQSKISRLKQSDKSISQAGPRVWNSLPNSCIQESGFASFKTKVKQYLLSKHY